MIAEAWVGADFSLDDCSIECPSLSVLFLIGFYTFIISDIEMSPFAPVQFWFYLARIL